jgi:hypothetical protein
MASIPPNRQYGTELLGTGDTVKRSRRRMLVAWLERVRAKLRLGWRALIG